MAENLTPQQRTAVENRGGRLLVSAAAGSGKTKVLVDRLLSYVTDPVEPANLDDFLIITYTKAAASELRGKIASKLNERIAEDPQNKHLQRQLQRLYLTQISTVHSFCANILREYAYRLDIPGDFRVADERECLQIQTQVLEKLLDNAYEDPDEDFSIFINSQELGRDDRMIPRIILKVYNSSRCHLDPDGWLQSCCEQMDTDELSDAGQTKWGKYLINDLREYLDMQIDAMSKCLKLAEEASGFEKPAILLSETIRQMEHLRACSTWDEICAMRVIDYGRLSFGKSADDQNLVTRIKAVREGGKAGLGKKLAVFVNSSRQVLKDLQDACNATRGLVALVRQFADEYEKAKKTRRVLDFSDLEHRMLDLVLGKKRSGPTTLASELGKRYKEIMVDEYQDSNGVQDAIFTALTAEKNNCFMVGDVKQSIYQFRLADPQIFLKKYSTYLPAEDAATGNGRKVMLSSNFRSAGAVIHAVNDVFTACMSPKVGGLSYGPDEMLHEGIPHISSQEREVELCVIPVQEDTYAEEAAYTAQRIQELLDGSHFVRQGDTFRPITEDDIVILLRSPGSVGREFTYALEKHGIRCSTGAGMDLLQTEEIITLRSFLQIIDNPLQDIPLLAVLSSRIFCFTADDLAAIRGKNRRCSVYEALCRDGSEKTAQFLEVLGQLREDAKMCTISQLIERIFTVTRMDSIFASFVDSEIRAANLQAFCSLASECQSTNQKELSQFLEFLDALQDKGLTVSAEQKTGRSVTIMSIHKSKGLEFPVVFLCGLSRDFNKENAREQVLCDRELGLGLNCVDLKNRVRYPTIAKRAIASKILSDGLSEEMRVLYVAMTRARDRLIMTYATKYPEKEISDLTSRMDICPKELLTADVSCPGQWVLLTALRRTESGALYALGGRPAEVCCSEPFWDVKVQTVQLDEPGAKEEELIESGVDRDVLERLSRSLKFSYAHSEATRYPSKQTATQMKGRPKDLEAAENSESHITITRNWRKPSFAEDVRSGTAYGNAVHAVMQHIRFEACADLSGIEAEISRLAQERLITQEQAKMVDCNAIERFFATDLGRRLRISSDVLREFKFSILDDAGKYSPGMEGEKILLQGVVDCALIEEQGITVIDFKTDHVTDETVAQAVKRYKTQIQVYADAISRIYQKPVISAQLYFFKLNRFVGL